MHFSKILKSVLLTSSILAFSTVAQSEPPVLQGPVELDGQLFDISKTPIKHNNTVIDISNYSFDEKTLQALLNTGFSLEAIKKVGDKLDKQLESNNDNSVLADNQLLGCLSIKSDYYVRNLQPGYLSGDPYYSDCASGPQSLRVTESEPFGLLRAYILVNYGSGWQFAPGVSQGGYSAIYHLAPPGNYALMGGNIGTVEVDGVVAISRSL